MNEHLYHLMFLYCYCYCFFSCIRTLGWSCPTYCDDRHADRCPMVHLRCRQGYAGNATSATGRDARVAQEKTRSCLILSFPTFLIIKSFYYHIYEKFNTIYIYKSTIIHPRIVLRRSSGRLRWVRFGRSKQKKTERARPNRNK